MKFSFKTRLILIGVIPVILIGIISVLIFSIGMNDALEDENEKTLKAVVTAVEETLESYDGNYEEKGEAIWKGSHNITKNEEMFDRIKEGTDTDVTFFWGDTRRLTTIKDSSGARIVGTQLDATISKDVLDGKCVFKSDAIIAEKDFYAYYEPVYQNGSEDEVVGIIFAGKSKEVTQETCEDVIMRGIIITVVVILLVIAAVWVIATSVVKKINEVSNIASDMSKGNLNVSVSKASIKRTDVIGDMARSMEDLIVSMKKFVGETKNSSEELHKAVKNVENVSVSSSTSINDVEKAVSEIAEGASDQANETQKASEDVMTMADLLQETTSKITNLHERADGMKEASENAKHVVNELQDTNRMTDEAIDAISKQTEVANESATKIKEAVDIISSISAQTNLLSLNASIEAARAGEQGKSFAVVASEIQILAEQSRESAGVINDIVKLLVRDSNKTVELMGEVKSVIGKQNENVMKTEEIFKVVNEGVISTVEDVDVIAEYAEKLNEIRNSIMDTIQNLSAIAQENAAASEETAAATTTVTCGITELTTATDTLENVARKLEESISLFK